jgi:hypothetical protein
MNGLNHEGDKIPQEESTPGMSCLYNRVVLFSNKNEILQSTFIFICLDFIYNFLNVFFSRIFLGT